MKNALARAMRLRHSCGWLATGLLMLPALAWVWIAAAGPVRSVFHVRSELLASLYRGSLLAQHFDIRHAGSCFDQPTIGKWLFLFTFMAVTSLPWAMAVRWLSDRKQLGAYLVYAFCGTVLGTFLLCMLVWPLVWLAQYVNSMGITPRRLRGIRYGSAGGLVVVMVVASAYFPLFTSQLKGAKRWLLGWGAAFAVITATMGGLFVWVNGPAWAGRFYCRRCVDHRAVAPACGRLMAGTAVTNRWGSVSFGPKGHTWRDVPPELRLWNIKEVCVGTNHVALIMRDRVNRLVLLENPTNAGLYELTWIDGERREVMERTRLPPRGGVVRRTGLEGGIAVEKEDGNEWH